MDHRGPDSSLWVRESSANKNLLDSPDVSAVDRKVDEVLNFLQKLTAEHTTLTKQVNQMGSALSAMDARLQNVIGAPSHLAHLAQQQPQVLAPDGAEPAIVGAAPEAVCRRQSVQKQFAASAAVPRARRPSIKDLLEHARPSALE
eukprot:5266365-Prymnesium_polylepis.1